MLNVLLSRTDRIGDVILTLPMAGLLKKINPNIKIFFLGRTYTEDIIRCSENIDAFINWDTLKSSPDPIAELKKLKIDTAIHVFPNKEFAKIAKKAKISTRIGTNRRWFHFIYCNKLVNLTRKNSQLHEAVLNIKLLKPFKTIELFKKNSQIENILDDAMRDYQALYEYYGFRKTKPLSPEHPAYKLLDPKKFNLIIHPKSGGSAQEWSLEKIYALARILDKEKFNVFFTGSEAERSAIQMPDHDNTQKNDSQSVNRTLRTSMCQSSERSHVKIHNVCGLFSLNEFISFIHACDGLIAASTGPLHIAAALGKNTLGLFPATQGMNAQRWGALGAHTQNIAINFATPENVMNIVLKWNLLLK